MRATKILHVHFFWYVRKYFAQHYQHNQGQGNTYIDTHLGANIHVYTHTVM